MFNFSPAHTTTVPMLSSADMSGLLVEQSVMLDTRILFDNAAVSSSIYCDSPLSDALGTDELDLLNQLLDFPEPADPASAFVADKATTHTATLRRERCADCSAHAFERSAKRLRAASTDGKTSKCKSQSQRQKEEITSLKQQVEELNAKLAEMQERKRQRELTSDSTTSDDNVDGQTAMQKAIGGAKRLWEGVAKRQQTELQSVEEENSALRDEVAKRWKQMKSLERSIINAQIDQLRQTNQHGIADELSAVISSA